MASPSSVDRAAGGPGCSSTGVALGGPDQSLDDTIGALLAAGCSIISQVGLWTSVRSPAPPTDYPRVSILTPSGPLTVPSDDPICRGLIAPATDLMLLLVGKAM